MRQITPTVKHLLIINIIVFIGTFLLGNKERQKVLELKKAPITIDSIEL